VASIDDDAQRIAVRREVDVEHAVRTARSAADRLGFDRIGAESVALAASELARNLLRYATDGVLTIRDLADRGLELESTDAGPGIGDVALALADRHSTGQGLGDGLGAVKRLMTEFEISTSPTGTCIKARRWPDHPF
jgi:serine/threonine-protein kinase RsbT